MPWFYVDDGFSDSKPIMNLPTTPVRVPMRIAAAGAWVLAGSWSAKEETDGFVPHTKLKSLLVPKSVVAALCEPGPLDAALCCPESDGILFKNWAKWQRTKAENEARRKREAEKKRNQRRHGRSFVTGVDGKMSPRDTADDAVTPGKVVSPRDSQSPTPPHPLVVTSQSVSAVGTHTAAAHTNSAPPRFCERHPNGTRQRCGDCANARIVFEFWEADRARRAEEASAATQAERRRQRELIDACPDCDDNGVVWIDDDTTARCTHAALDQIPHPEGANL